METKEKAEELFTTYRFSLSIPNAPLGDLKDSIAKQCALIAVDEIIAQIEPSVSMDVISARINYWKEVKKEIEKL
jgi:hypothetical protein